MLDALNTVATLLVYTIGGGVLLLIVAFFVALAWLIVKTCVDSVRSR